MSSNTLLARMTTRMTRILRSDVLLNATICHNKQGNMIGIVGIGQDIPSKLAQEWEYSRLINTVNAPIFSVDTFGCVNVWNMWVSCLIGFSNKEVMGRSLVKDLFIPDNFKPPVQTVLDQALVGDKNDNCGYHMEGLLYVTSCQDQDKQGDMIGMVGLGQDITARLLQEQKYSKLIDMAIALIFGMDMHSAVNVWN